MRVFSWAQCQVRLIYPGWPNLKAPQILDGGFFVVVVNASCGFSEDLLCFSQPASTLSDAP